MLRSIGCFLLTLATTSAAIAEPSKFTCVAPRSKRVELSASGKGNEAQWIDDDLETVRPAVVIDGETFAVSWGMSVADGKAGPKLTTYVFAAAHRSAASIFATCVDESAAEIFRFFFASKDALQANEPTGRPLARLEDHPFVATYLATCRGL
ncbi:hypothetical protein [Bradyrhizobium sp. USDA 3364]